MKNLEAYGRATRNPFTVYGQPRNNLFTLHGTREDVATYAVGFVLAHSRTFLAQFMKNLKDTNISDRGGKGIEKIEIKLEKHVKEQAGRDGKAPRRGRTDIEIGIENNFRLIIEAKRWWGIASDEQLEKYAYSIVEKDGDAYLMTISQAGVSKHESFPNASGKKIPVIHRSWKDIQNIVALAIKNRGSDEWENILLRDLYVHLAHYVFQERGSVCIVSLSANRKTNLDFSFRSIVTKGGGYFHPIDSYPEEQIPDYLGFRWGARLHLLLKIKGRTTTGYKFEATGKEFPVEGDSPEPLSAKKLMWSDKDKKDHRIYKLEGENLLPGGKSIRSGNINHRGMQWCNFDFLCEMLKKPGKHKTLKEILDAADRKREEDAEADLQKFLKGE